MQLTTKYRPRRLRDIVGQQPARWLEDWVRNPHPKCFLCEGPGGSGKTATAYALAYELGCRPFPEHTFSGLHTQEGAAFDVDAIREFCGPHSPVRFCCDTTRDDGKGWHVVVIEELDFVSPQAQKALKTALDPANPGSILNLRCVVVATSNGAARLGGPLLQRFKLFSYSGGPTFATACRERLALIWAAETSSFCPLPTGWQDWGWTVDPDMMGMKTWSMRVAMDRMANALMKLETQPCR